MSDFDSKKQKSRSGPDFSCEQALIEKGILNVAGIDEAGRGPLAGPVVAAAVILEPENIPCGLDDSKKLTPAKREFLFENIMSSAVVCVVSAPPIIIEKLNIRGATLWAMAAAARGLALVPGHALIDGRDVPDQLCCPGQALIGGDGRSLSVAAASIIAKVMRDRMCPVMEGQAPGYGFAAHKGYGTAKHMQALQKLGASPHHRKGFAPVAAVLDKTGHKGR